MALTKVSCVASSLMLLTWGCGSAPSTEPVRDRFATNDDLPFSSSGFESYRSWQKVNPEPLQLASWLDLMCRSLTKEEKALKDADPHQDKWFTVYVNNVATRRMEEGEGTDFPVGSAIVKEKTPSKSGGEVELVTAMVKRESGFSPNDGDWEYFVVSGDASKIIEQGQIASCRGCHATQRANDYVFANYLPANQ